MALGRWAPLAITGTAQVVIVLDSTVVTIALPVVQQQLALTDLSRGWVVTAYALAFGGLLLVGGRIAERMGLRRGFAAGLVGFALASLVAGLAPTGAVLFAGRALQGAFAALLAPAALAIVSTTYTHGPDRARAFGVFGALNGAGAALGLLLGGVLTEYVSWRWCLLINVPIAAVALAFTRGHVPRTEPRHVRIDITGAALSAVAIGSLVFALTEGGALGWASPVTVGCFALAALALTGFILAHRFTAEPLLPFTILLDRRRGSAFLAIGLPQMALFGFYLVLTYWFQGILGWPALLAGAAFLPLAVAIVVSSTALAGLLTRRFSQRTVLTGALTVMALGMLLLVGLDPDDGTVYVVRFLPAQLLVGAGLGCSLSLAIPAATSGVAPAEAGVASAAVNTFTQLGGAVGLAALNTVAAGVTAAALRSDGSAAGQVAATVAGYDAAVLAAAGVLVLAAALVGLIGRESARQSVQA